MQKRRAMMIKAPKERERREEKRKSCLITRFKSTSSSSLMHRNGGCVFTSTANVFFLSLSLALFSNVFVSYNRVDVSI